MNKFFAILPVLLATTLNVQATNLTYEQIPNDVLKGLKSDHPDANNIKATRQKHFGETYYEMQFKLHGTPHEALYDRHGEPFGHEEEVARLPKKINDQLRKMFSNYQIINAVSLQHPDGRIEYEIDVRSEDVLWEVVTDDKGKILVKEKL